MAGILPSRSRRSTTAHRPTDAYRSFEAFLEAFSAALTARFELIDREQEPLVRAWLASLQKLISVSGTKP